MFYRIDHHLKFFLKRAVARLLDGGRIFAELFGIVLNAQRFLPHSSDLQLNPILSNRLPSVSLCFCADQECLIYILHFLNSGN
jgi:hypothetical protein